ncbi:hypothetical protein B0H21DRAFT_713726 [Amylocystis lapponica]|nr:hypothetical protein B0H21DRAFT_713726 [Amylocystis lapponica]
MSQELEDGRRQRANSDMGLLRVLQVGRDEALESEVAAENPPVGAARDGGERGDSELAQSRDMLAQEFTEMGINALRRLSGASVALPGWMIMQYEVDREEKAGTRIRFLLDVHCGTCCSVGRRGDGGAGNNLEGAVAHKHTGVAGGVIGVDHVPQGPATQDDAQDCCKFFHSIKPLFVNKPTVLIINKIDVAYLNDLVIEDHAPENRALAEEIMNGKGVQHVQVACYTNEGVMELKNKVCWDDVMCRRKDKELHDGLQVVQTAGLMCADGGVHGLVHPGAAGRRGRDPAEPRRWELKDAQERGGQQGALPHGHQCAHHAGAIHVYVLPPPPSWTLTTHRELEPRTAHHKVDVVNTILALAKHPVFGTIFLLNVSHTTRSARAREPGAYTVCSSRSGSHSSHKQAHREAESGCREATYNIRLPNELVKHLLALLLLRVISIKNIRVRGTTLDRQRDFGWQCHACTTSISKIQLCLCMSRLGEDLYELVHDFDAPVAVQW